MVSSSGRSRPTVARSYWSGVNGSTTASIAAHRTARRFFLEIWEDTGNPGISRLDPGLWTAPSRGSLRRASPAAKRIRWPDASWSTTTGSLPLNIYEPRDVAGVKFYAAIVITAVSAELIVESEEVLNVIVVDGEP